MNQLIKKVCTCIDSEWTLGKAGENCNEVCGKTGRVCNSVEQSMITDKTLIKEAMSIAGQTCKVVKRRSYAGTPFFSKGTCVHLNPGAKSVCDNNRVAWHSALCYCKGNFG